MPALPLHEAGKYVAGAYLVFLALILIYVAVMAIRQARLQREIEELAQLVEARLDRDEEQVRGTIPTGAATTSSATGMVQ
jgi:CHASE1-domain containing sensor protein